MLLSATVCPELATLALKSMQSKTRGKQKRTTEEKEDRAAEFGFRNE